MKPSKGSNYLRKGRTSIKNQHYLLTTKVLDRKPVFNRENAAAVVLNSLHWLENQEKIILDAAVVMPDHLHFVAGLINSSLATIMRSLKSHTAKKINILLERDGPFWQPQYHDHAVRMDEDLNEVVLYTLHNPVRAGLATDFRDYPYWYCRWDV
jgi:putative transposase